MEGSTDVNLELALKIAEAMIVAAENEVARHETQRGVNTADAAKNVVIALGIVNGFVIRAIVNEIIAPENRTTVLKHLLASVADVADTAANWHRREVQ